MNWRFCVTDPQGHALKLCLGSMDEGDGFGYGYGRGSGSGYGDGDGDGGDGDSPPEW
jgi:hypothetical protein